MFIKAHIHFDAIALCSPADQIEGQPMKCYNRRNP